MVISTRAVSAVIMAIILVKPSRTRKADRLFKSCRSKARVAREPKRTLKFRRASEIMSPRYLTFLSNYSVKYYNVEISTRDGFAVITAIMFKVTPHSPILNRPFKVGLCTTRKSGEYIRTPNIPSSTTITNTFSQSLGGNYTHNYDNVEITMRDVSAVIRQLVGKQVKRACTTHIDIQKNERESNCTLCQVRTWRIKFMPINIMYLNGIKRVYSGLILRSRLGKGGKYAAYAERNERRVYIYKNVCANTVCVCDNKMGIRLSYVSVWI